MHKKWLQVMLVVVLGVGISACFEVDETVTLNADGSGTADIAVRLAIDESKKNSAMTPTATMFEGVGLAEGLSVAAPKVTQERGQTTLTISVTAQKFQNFSEIYKQGAKGGDSGSKDIRNAFSQNEFYSVKKVGADRLRITRTFFPTKVVKKGSAKDKKKKDALDMDFASMMTGFSHFDLNVPTKILSHNGDSVVGNIIRWVVPMTYMQTHKMQFVAEIAATPELLKGLGL